MDETKIKAQWSADNAERAQGLDIVRECCRLCDPTLLPYPDAYANRQPNNRILPQNYQSLGSVGAVNIEGKVLTAVYPAGIPWFKEDLSAEMRADPTVPDEVKQALLHDLAMMDLIVLASLESNSKNGQLQPNTFRSQKRKSIGQLIITGDTLERMHDDLRIQVFSRDQYVTLRDSCGEVIYHITMEKIDPLRQLTEEQFAKSKLNREDLKAQHPAKRMMPIYTLVESQPQTRKWVIKQEINEQIVNTSEEEVSPYISTPFKLVDNYGRGLIELHLGDMFSFDEGSLRMLDYMEMCSKFLTVVDNASNIRDRDWAKRTGSVIRGRVAGGAVQDAAIMKVDKVADFSVCAKVMEMIERRLAKIFLTASEAVRDSERTTAYEVAKATIAELEGALGGVYAPIADYQQIQTLNRAMWQLRKDKKLPLLTRKITLPNGQTVSLKDFIKVDVLTGAAALADENRARQLEQLVVTAQTLGDAGVAKLNAGTVLDAIARFRRINEPGVIKSNEQVATEQQRAMQLAAQAAAVQKGVEVAGNVAESQYANAG